MTGRIFQLNVSPGGVPKLPIREARLSPLGLEGDGHVHAKFHGGPERALCLYSLEVIQALQAEGHPIFAGSTGENVTISGVAWGQLRERTRLALGREVVIELTRPTTPCKQIKGSFTNGSWKRISHLEHPAESRWYARVERTGTLRVADDVQIL